MRITLIRLLALAIVSAASPAFGGLSTIVNNHFTVTELGNSDLFEFDYGTNSKTGASGQGASITGNAPQIVGTGVSQGIVINGTGSLTAPTNFNDGLAIYRLIGVEVCSTFDIKYSAEITVNSSPSAFNGGLFLGGITGPQSAVAYSGGPGVYTVSLIAPGLSGTPASPAANSFELGASAFSKGIPFDAPLDVDFVFELILTPTTFVDADMDGVNDLICACVPEPNPPILLSLTAVVVLAFRRRSFTTA